MYRPEIEGFLQRAYLALEEKVKEAPLTDEDLKAVFEVHIAPRLERMGISDAFERKQIEDYIFSKLNDRSRQLNSQYWGK
jgi:hypothetical protein